MKSRKCIICSKKFQLSNDNRKCCSVNCSIKLTKQTQRKYYQRPEVKEMVRKYYQRPEAKEKRRQYNKEYRQIMKETK